MPSLARSCRRFRTRSSLSRSSDAVGSSVRMIRLGLRSNRAKATRCCSPPLRVCTGVCSCPGSPTRSKADAKEGLGSKGLGRAAMSRFSRTVALSSRA
ncbi:hypothetical protein PAZ_c08450 [Cutibacterium acnes 266]|nr:hypothetical protein PAZ_c08450 [Cutibacterium acnes 266]